MVGEAGTTVAETSVRAYEAQMKETRQTATRFAGILIAERGNMAKTRRKNDELIALAAKFPEMFPIASVHPYDDQAALNEVRRIAGLGVTMIRLHREHALNEIRLRTHGRDQLSVLEHNSVRANGKRLLQGKYLFRYIGDGDIGRGFTNQVRVRMDDSHRLRTSC
jgi:hypothetical protein